MDHRTGRTAHSTSTMLTAYSSQQRIIARRRVLDTGNDARPDTSHNWKKTSSRWSQREEPRPGGGVVTNLKEILVPYSDIR